MKCQYCKAVCVKIGKQKSGVQKFRCKTCRKYQQEECKYQACLKITRQLIVPMVTHNMGFRGTSDTLHISVNTVRKTIVTESEKCEPPFIPYGGIFEVDEMLAYHKIGNPEIWAVYALERKTKNVIGISVGRRTKATLRKTINAVMRTNPKRIYTDGLRTYKTIIPESLHKNLRHLMSQIERLQLTARNGLKMLNRKTLAFVRSDKTLLACLKLLFWG